MNVRDIFAAGQTFDEYRESTPPHLTHVIDDVYDEYEPSTRATEWFRAAASRDVRAIAVVTPECDDCAVAMPILSKLSELCGMPLRTVPRSDFAEFASRHAEGRDVTPVIAFFDGHWQRVGAYVGRPEPQLEGQEYWDAIAERMAVAAGSHVPKGSPFREG